MLQSARLTRLALRRPARAFHTSLRRFNEAFDPNTVERASDDVDVCIVGGGPAGLSAAIRLKQLEQEKGREIRVVVLEKGGEVGSHILSGAVIEPRALHELIPDWLSRDGHPLVQPATSSTMRFFTQRHSFPMPHPPQMSNDGNYILSLSQFTAWLGSIAEELGVEIYPGFAGASLVYTEDGKGIAGVRTNDVGLDRMGRPKDNFEPGMEFRARVTLLAEGARGSLTKTVVRRFDLAKDADPQTYGLGVKEVWRVDPSQYRAGSVVHTMGWPLDMQTYGGGWVYHMADGLVSLGLVIGLDYANPYLSPFRELQRMKHHPWFAKLLSGDSERVGYGARVLNEGGLQSVPKLHFPGGALVGCAAGFVNVAKIKGTHNAMKTGMLAAEAAFDAVAQGDDSDAPADMSAYETAFKDSWVYKDLYEVRNLRPSFHTPLGIPGGIMYSGVDSLLLRGRTPYTLHNPRTTDAKLTRRASEFKPIVYPLPQPPLSTDLLTALQLTGTNHAEDQPAHLRVRTEGGVEGAERRGEHVRVNVEEYAGLLGRGCPAAVYEYVDDEDGSAGKTGWGGKKLVINAQNCIHCKFCDVKVPTEDIQWTVPEGGGGPKYTLT